MGTSRARRSLFIALAGLLALGFVVLSLETLGRLLLADRLLLLTDLDHRMKPHAFPEINGDGIRSRLEAEAFVPEGLNVVMLGDSFVYGSGLAYEDTIPYRIERLARAAFPEAALRVANFGWVSASPFLSARQLGEIGHRYAPDLVVLAIDMTDIHDDAKYRRLAERTGIFALAELTPTTFLALRKTVTPFETLHRWIFGFPADKFFVTARPLKEVRPYYDDLRASLDALHLLATRELAAGFTVVVFPRCYQYSDRESPESWEAGSYQPLGPYVLEPFRYFESLAAEAAYPIHSLLPDFQATEVFPTCFEHDPHWNAAGAEIAAAAIYRRVVAPALERGQAAGSALR